MRIWKGMKWFGVVMAVVMVAGAGWAQNMLNNPGGETGDFTGWDRFSIGDQNMPTMNPSTHILSCGPVNDPCQNHSGNYRFGLSVGWMQTEAIQYQTLAVSPGTSYPVSLWYFTGADEGTELRLQVTWVNGFYPGTENQLYNVQQNQGTQVRQYTQLSGQSFTPTGSMATLVVRYAHQNGTRVASIHVDDIMVQGTAGPSPTNTPTFTHTATRTPTNTYTPAVSNTPIPSACCVGDADHNGFVNAMDYREVRNRFGDPAQPGDLGDADCQGFVNALDYRAVRDSFGNTCP